MIFGRRAVRHFGFAQCNASLTDHGVEMGDWERLKSLGRLEGLMGLGKIEEIGGIEEIEEIEVR